MAGSARSFTASAAPAAVRVMSSSASVPDRETRCISSPPLLLMALNAQVGLGVERGVDLERRAVGAVAAAAGHAEVPVPGVGDPVADRVVRVLPIVVTGSAEVECAAPLKEENIVRCVGRMAGRATPLLERR